MVNYYESDMILLTVWFFIDDWLYDKTSVSFSMVGVNMPDAFVDDGLVSMGCKIIVEYIRFDLYVVCTYPKC